MGQRKEGREGKKCSKIDKVFTELKMKIESEDLETQLGRGRGSVGA